MLGQTPTRRPSSFPVRSRSFAELDVGADRRAGYPRVWKGLQVPFQAPRDADVIGDFTYFKDQNGYRLQAYSLLPILAAVDALAAPADAPVDWRGTDYIMDRNAMHKLLHLLDPNQRELRDFRLDAQRVGARTVLVAQWEPRHIERSHSHTFWAGFLETATAPPPGCEGTTGYFRVASYVRTSHRAVSGR
jgi:hypothetical protein